MGRRYERGGGGFEVGEKFCCVRVFNIKTYTLTLIKTLKNG